jgi:EF-hand domain
VTPHFNITQVTPEQEQRLRKAFAMWDGDGDGRLNQAEFMDVLRALDVAVDDPATGTATLVSVARAAGVTTPLVSFEQARDAGLLAVSLGVCVCMWLFDCREVLGCERARQGIEHV